jgi:hypothetical protein
MGYWGYDNITKKYTGTWMDSMGTAMMNSTGKMDASGKVMTYTAMVNDPMTGKLARSPKGPVTDNDHHMMEMYPTRPGRTTDDEITYVRRSRSWLPLVILRWCDEVAPRPGGGRRRRRTPGFSSPPVSCLRIRIA